MSFVTNQSRRKILFRLGVVGIIIAIPLLVYGVFMLILYFTMETPKDNDVILRDLNEKKYQDHTAEPTKDTLNP